MVAMAESPQTDERLGELEALLFASPAPLAARLLARRLEISEAETLGRLQQLAAQLQAPGRGLQLRETQGGWRLETKPEHAEIVRFARAERRQRPLSQQALESLAVVALRQPVSTDEVSAIRGLDSAATLDTLRKRKMIAKTEAAHPSAPNPGESRAARWRTTQNFLDLFGLESLADLYRENRLEDIFGSSREKVDCRVPRP
jgi:segregation and condensation protein B